MMKYLFYCCVLIIIGASCKREQGKFISIPASTSHIDFNNKITENDSINVFAFENVYNGGGVGIGDFNNDGLEDIYFTGNMVSNRLYLNKGSFKFEDVAKISETDGAGVWSRGVAIIDINNDGWLDIYVCATARKNPAQRINLLYINQGVKKDSQSPVFKEMAKEYGLDDTSQSTMAYFFDYDNDDDLDLFIAVNHIVQTAYANTFRKRNLHGEHPSTSRLYRNDWNDSLKHAVYKNVSTEAGVTIEGYSHAAGIADFNADGWTDILVTNDYLSPNVLYINNQDGTFTDHVTDYFKHTAFNSMGTDVVDINNDGWRDVIEVDMDPQDNYRKKMFQGPGSYQFYINNDLYGYQYQYARNMLQLNMGPSVGNFDSLGHPVFADIGFYAQMAETDWSWTPLVADFDQDGNKDIIYTNGYPKDITDRDFATYRKEAMRLSTKEEILAAIPEVKIHNYVYQNHGDLHFTDQTEQWGFNQPDFSNGAAYADLDNDGDLDMIINNIGDPASLYENRLNEIDKKANHFLKIKITGSEKNINALGATVECYAGGKQFSYENMPFRGYLSTQSSIVNIGLGDISKIDSVIVHWSDKKLLKLKNVQVDQQITAAYPKAVLKSNQNDLITSTSWFTNISHSMGQPFIHQQDDYIDFNIQKLLPHKFSEYAPAITVADINGDSIDDFIVAGSPGHSATIFLAERNGQFRQSVVEPSANKKQDERGLLLFDVDADGHPDLISCSGGYSYNPSDSAYQDRLFLNDGKGKFHVVADALPFNTTSKLCIRAADIDHDGDLDLFLSGRVQPKEYPKPVSSFIYRNESTRGKPKFTDVTATAAPMLNKIGLSCDALFSDYDNDGWSDLIIAGEWMPLTFLHNDKGVFKNVTNASGISDSKGWWTSIVAADFDNDNDIDYVVGNLGLNSFYRASKEHPVAIRAADFDHNGSYDAIPSLYLPATLKNGSVWKEFPAFGRDDMIKQVISTRIKYQNYRQYALAVIDSIVTPAMMKDAIKLEANYMASSFVRNDGNGKFSITELPAIAQFSTLNGMVADDFNGDGNTDIAINTNDYGTDVLMGRYDALNGLVLQGDGKGGFMPLKSMTSGIFIPGNGKALVKMLSADGNYLVAGTQNRGPLQLFKTRNKEQVTRFNPDDLFATITLSNGKKQRVENFIGSSWLSQSSLFFCIPKEATNVEITNIKAIKRTVQIEKSAEVIK